MLAMRPVEPDAWPGRKDLIVACRRAGLALPLVEIEDDLVFFAESAGR